MKANSPIAATAPITNTLRFAAPPPSFAAAKALLDLSIAALAKPIVSCALVSAFALVLLAKSKTELRLVKLFCPVTFRESIAPLATSPERPNAPVAVVPAIASAAPTDPKSVVDVLLVVLLLLENDVDVLLFESLIELSAKDVRLVFDRFELSKNDVALVLDRFELSAKLVVELRSMLLLLPPTATACSDATLRVSRLVAMLLVVLVIGFDALLLESPPK